MHIRALPDWARCAFILCKEDKSIVRHRTMLPSQPRTELLRFQCATNPSLTDIEPLRKTLCDEQRPELARRFAGKAMFGIVFRHFWSRTESGNPAPRMLLAPILRRVARHEYCNVGIAASYLHAAIEQSTAVMQRHKPIKHVRRTRLIDVLNTKAFHGCMLAQPNQRARASLDPRVTRRQATAVHDTRSRFGCQGAGDNGSA
jgi:hypothetical protein